MSKRIGLSVLLAFALSGLNPLITTAADVILNGGFETASINIWAFGLYPTLSVPEKGTGVNLPGIPNPWGNSVANWTDYNGAYIRKAGVPDYSTYAVPSFGDRMFVLIGGSTESQSFNVSVGSQYEVSYYQVNTALAPAGTKLTASISGVTTGSGTFRQDAETSFTNGWTLHTFTFAPAASGTGTLTFTGTGGDADRNGAQLDNVSVIESPAPAPGTNTTTLSVDAGAGPHTYGDSVTLTATVNATPAPVDGTVQFYDGVDMLGAPQAVNGSGVATFTTSALAVGSRTITATYFPALGSDYLPSTGTTTVDIAAPIIQNGSFETATIGIWGQGWVDVGGPGQGTCLISDWGNGAASVANWTFSTSLNGGGLWGNSFMGTYLRQGNDPTAIINDYSAYVAPTPFGTRQWNLLYGSTISQSFPVTVNNQYEVKYYQCNTAQAAAGTKLTATISGIAAIGTLTQDANTAFADGLTLHTFTFEPTASGTALLSFSPGTTPVYQTLYGAQLDNVSVTETPVTTTTTTTTTAGTSTSSTTTTTTTTTAPPIIQNGSFETATISLWGNGFVGGPAQGTCLISDWGNGAASVANWTFSTSLNGGGLWGSSYMGMYLRQGNDPTVTVDDYSAHVAPTPFGTRQWNLLYGSTVSQSFAVTAGIPYEVKYYQCNTAYAAAGVKLTATISGVPAAGTLTQEADTPFASGLTLHTFVFTPAASGTATLSFSPGTTPTYQNQYGAQLDNVSVKAFPPTGALMILR